MGFAIARAAQEAGAEVTLVAGPVALPTPRHVRRIDVTSAQQMFDAVLPAAPAHDVFVATAAVADWRPAQASGHKIKKEGKKTVPGIELTENPDILASVARLPPDRRPWCVGFAAESRDLVKHARDKLVRKGVPLIVGNLGPATFGRDAHSLLLVAAAGARELPRRFAHAGMLDRRNRQRAGRQQGRRAFEEQVVGFGTAAGEYDLRRLRADRVRHPLPRFVDRPPRGAAVFVTAGGIAIPLRQIRQHAFQHARIQRRGGVMIEIDRREHGSTAASTHRQRRMLAIRRAFIM
jgi:hypothetical protein